MDYKQVVRDQIDRLQGMQKRMLAKDVIDYEATCRVAETILLLCKEIRNIPTSK